MEELTLEKFEEASGKSLKRSPWKQNWSIANIFLHKPEIKYISSRKTCSIPVLIK